MISDTGRKVQEFYNKKPFPDYELDNFHSKEDLKNLSDETLDGVIPKEASVIDVGTGTGQLSAFLSLRRKCAWGIDFSDTPLNKARLLKKKIGLNSWHLKKVNIMDVKQIEDIGMKFDYVLCLGVLHHTENAYQGFKNILRLLKPNGYIAIGLYNKFGKLSFNIRKYLMKKKIIKVPVKDNRKLQIWFDDQYLHPHQTNHTISEVLRWFKKNNIKYYGSMWGKEIYPYFPIRAYKQMVWLWKRNHYWVTFGKRK